MRLEAFRASYPNLDFITSNDSFFDTVKVDFLDHQAGGFFHKSTKKAIFVYQIKGSSRAYNGLIACLNIHDFIDGHIRKHEQTITEQEQKQIQLLIKRKAVVKPILLGYRRIEEVENWLQLQIAQKAPFQEIYFEREDQTHRFWEITDPVEIEQARDLFARYVNQTYIADGHHRTTTTAIMYGRRPPSKYPNPYRRLLCALFGSEQLEVLPYHRIISGLSEYTPSRFMARLSQLFDIEVLEKAEVPRAKYELLLFVHREWYRLRWRPHVLNEYSDQAVILDTMLLNEKVLKGIIGIEDVRNDTRIEYVDGQQGLEGLRIKTLENENKAGFYLFPVQLDEIIQLADINQMLPPKSTWFEPRMKNGLTVLELALDNEE